MADVIRVSNSNASTTTTITAIAASVVLSAATATAEDSAITGIEIPGNGGNFVTLEPPTAATTVTNLAKSTMSCRQSTPS